MKITFCGDTHAKFKAIENLFIQETPDMIIQVGDFGIWPGYYKKLNFNKCPLYFCRGNHEDHDLLDHLPFGEISEINKLNEFKHTSNIFMCDTGSFLSEYGILFIGGAESIDKLDRQAGKSWWPQEVISHKQTEFVLDQIRKYSSQIKIVVSHTCPTFLINESIKLNDPTASFLEYVFELIQPELWIHGHFHNRYEKIIDDTKFIGLDMCSSQFDGKYFEGFFYNYYK